MLLGNIFYLMGIYVHPIFTQIQIQTNLLKSVAKKHHFGLRYGIKEPKYGLRDISITIQILKMDSAPLNHIFLALSTSQLGKNAKCLDTFCSEVGLTANFSKWEPSLGSGAWKN